MNCPKCDGATKVVDRRSVRRRRECLVCKHRFSTVEMLASDVPKAVAEKIEAAAPEKPKAPKKVTPKKVNPVSKVSIKSNADARRKIEDVREQRRAREDFDYLDPDYDYLPEKW